MCGIFGFSWQDKQLLNRMDKALLHRGPDDHGNFFDNQISLGHRRLSIIDLSKKGRQPISNENGTIWVVFNGEIYNHKKIRIDLEKKGHKFFSETDTEVIVHLYEEKGESFVNYLNGCFGIALWDSKRKKLILVRDRLGIKPVYYSILGEEIIFASEIKAILESNKIKRKVNLDALHEFLSFRCNSLSQTMFEGIHKLLPGEMLIYTKEKDYKNNQFEKRIIKKRYWQLYYPKQSKRSFNSLKNELRIRLKESVKKRMMSDVPLGAYLSGGVDSGSIVGLMSQMSEEPIKTFSVGFNDSNHDELNRAKKISEYFGTEHREIIVDSNSANVLPQIVWNNDEPMSDATCIPIYLLSEKTKKHATVVLTGDGGDEQFIGYEQYKFMKLHNHFLRHIPKVMRSSLIWSVRNTPKQILDTFFKYASSLGEEGINRFGEYLKSNNYSRQYLNLVSIFSEKEKKTLYSNKLNIKNKRNLIREIKKEYYNNNWNYLQSTIRLDIKKILAEDFLMKIDKNTMSSGIEARVPLLDHTFVEFCARIPLKYKLKGYQDKYIFRKAMEKFVPKMTSGAKKDRFFVPVDNWFKGELKEVTKQIMDPAEIHKQGFFKSEQIEKLFKNYNKSQLFYGRQLWSLLNFQIWHQIYIEGKKKDKII